MVDAMRSLRPLAGRRLLAIDSGARFVGLAVRTSHLEGARPYGLVERIVRGGRGGETLCWRLERDRSMEGGGTSRFKSLDDALEHVLAEQRVTAAVLGMPYHADGSYSPECSIVERLAQRLQHAWKEPVPILLWDESWSTRLAVGPRRRETRGSHALAACIILQEVLTALHPLESTDDPLQRLPER